MHMQSMQWLPLHYAQNLAVQPCPWAHQPCHLAQLQGQQHPMPVQQWDVQMPPHLLLQPPMAAACTPMAWSPVGQHLGAPLLEATLPLVGPPAAMHIPLLDWNVVLLPLKLGQMARLMRPRAAGQGSIAKF